MRYSTSIATIFSYAANEDDPEDVLQEEGFDTDALDQTSRDFLESAIQDYNAAFNTNFDSSSDKFQNYYKHWLPLAMTPMPKWMIFAQR